MDKQRIREIQQKIGTTVDGFWGPKSTFACQQYLRSLMPLTIKSPGGSLASLREFYGSPGDENNLVGLGVPVGVVVKYEGKQVSTIRCHHKVAESLRSILVELSQVCPGVLLEYAGCYNNRSIRGGSTPSLHSWGAAIDLKPDTNGNHTHWPTGADMPLEVMEVFSRHGWLSAGAFWSRDAMHFQFTH